MRRACGIGIIRRVRTAVVHLVLLLFSAKLGFSQTAVTVMNNGDSKNRIDIAILGDGYTALEMGKYADDVRKAVDGIFTQQPLAEYRDYFNVHRIDVVSIDSGADHPESGIYKNTAFDSAYNCQGIQRLICASTSKVITAASNALSPTQRDVYLVIVNDSQYGGSGGSIAVVSTHPSVVELILHEEGHTLGLLGDEYGGPPPPYCDTAYEPSQANITMQTQRNQIKWNAWIDAATPIPTNFWTNNTPGLYQGAQYCDAGKYRPTYNSKMRSLDRSFDSINTEQLIKRLYAWVSPLDSSMPSAAAVTVSRGQHQHFSVTTPKPATHALKVRWFLNDTFMDEGTDFAVDTGSLAVGVHTVQAAIQDTTDMVRNDPAAALAETRNWSLKVTAPTGLALPLNAGGAASVRTGAQTDAIRTGYAELDVNTGATPYGTAVFQFRQNGATVSEAGVPPSLPTRSARIFIDYRAGINALPGRGSAGLIDTNTGIAVVNRNSAAANITYTLRNMAGDGIATGHGIIAAGAHIACFIDQLQQKAAPDFNLPPDFRNTVQFGSLEIGSDLPVSVLALRGTTNQRNEFLITTTPVADLAQPLSQNPVYLPHFVDGGGYTTSLILLNTSGREESGTLEILDDNGNPLAAAVVGESSGSTFRYAIKSGGAVHFQTDGSAPEPKSGWVRLTPDWGCASPVSSGIFGYNPGATLVSESGIPSATLTTHARIYVDLTGKYNTGLAIANTATTPASILIRAYQKDGITAAGEGPASLSIAAAGHSAAFASQYVAGLSEGFTGVIDIESGTPFAALTLRSLTNENGDFLMTTFPIADAAQPAPAPVLFPQIADGGGFSTQLVLISPAAASNSTLHFYDESGQPLDLVH